MFDVSLQSEVSNRLDSAKNTNLINRKFSLESWLKESFMESLRNQKCSVHTADSRLQSSLWIPEASTHNASVLGFNGFNTLSDSHTHSYRQLLKRFLRARPETLHEELMLNKHHGRMMEGFELLPCVRVAPLGYQRRRGRKSHVKSQTRLVFSVWHVEEIITQIICAAFHPQSFRDIRDESLIPYTCDKKP